MKTINLAEQRTCACVYHGEVIVSTCQYHQRIWGYWKTEAGADAAAHELHDKPSSFDPYNDIDNN